MADKSLTNGKLQSIYVGRTEVELNTDGGGPGGGAKEGNIPGYVHIVYC